MRNFLSEMLYALTSAYTRKDYDNQQRGLPPETKIGKLFSVFAWGLDMVQEQAEKIKAWDNLDNACGAVLDRYGANFGVKRDGTTDDFYRLEIRVKIMSQLSGGDDDMLIKAAAELLGVENSDIELEDVFPAKKKIMVNALVIPPERQKLIDQIAVDLKRLLAAGVGLGMYLVYLFKHTIEVGYRLDAWSYLVPPCNTLYCGTYPSRATLGWTTRAVLRASVRLSLPVYLTRFCGIYPEVAALGLSTKTNIRFGADVLSCITENELCGDVLCGMQPAESSVGWREQTSMLVSDAIEVFEYLVKECGTYPDTATQSWLMEVLANAGFSFEDVASTPPATNTEHTGVYPNKAEIVFIVDGGAEVSGVAEGFRKTIARCNMTDCGVSPKPTSTGGLTEADMTVSGLTEGILIDTPYEPKDCGTAPQIIGTGAQVSANTAFDCSATGFATSTPLCNTKYCGQD